MGFKRSWSGDFGEGLMDVVEEEMLALGMRRGEDLIRKTIDHKGINYEGDLRSSVTTNVTTEGQSVQMEVGPDVEHAEYVQFGTRPHRAPFDPIKRWARKKLGDESAWWPVWLSIERTGTDPQDYLTGPGRILAREAPDEIEDAIADHLNEDG